MKIKEEMFYASKNNWIKDKLMYFVAKIFGKYCVGIDYAHEKDKCIKSDCYIFRNKVYIRSIKEIKNG